MAGRVGQIADIQTQALRLAAMFDDELHVAVEDRRAARSVRQVADWRISALS
jgi:hypothetical protein